MLFKKFIEDTTSWWNKYLAMVNEYQEKGHLDSGECIVLYPNMILFTEVRGYYIAELIGAQKKFNRLKIKRHKEKSIYKYLGQFSNEKPDPLMTLNAAYLSFRFLSLSQEADFEAVRARFPFIELYKSRLNRVGGRGCVFDFGDNFSSCYIENSVLINRHENVFRCKNILEMIIVKNNIINAELIELFNEITKGNKAKAIHTAEKGREASLLLAGQFQSMYLFPGLRETTLGEFIKSHPEIILRAFKTDNFIYEPYLNWLEHDGTVKDDAINPDLLVKRNDGFYDIYDLKTAASNKKKITKGPKKRRRFIDYIEEGAAQLANYREYFKYDENRELAQRKYGIKVSNPKLVIIVGIWENVDFQEIREATRRYKEIDIIDYDTFAHLFLGIE